MSGVKYSKIKLERERKACQEARAEISRLEEAIASFRGQVQGALSAIPEGVQASFPQELERVRQWLGLAVPRAASGINSRRLLGVVEQLRRLADESKACLSCVVGVRDIRREAKGKELMGCLEVLMGEVR